MALPVALPSARVRPPRVRDDVVSRPRLLARLDAGAGTLLTLVVAPAGFGKTMLLADWAARARRPVAWLALDESDADADVLWRDVQTALAALFPEAVGDVSAHPSDLAAGVERLGPAVLVLDGYEHVASAKRADASLWRFARERPRSLQLVVSGRCEPSLPLATARAHGELVEVRMRDLELTADEAPYPADLVERCGGWPAALRLAAAGPGWPAQLRELVVGELLDGLPVERTFLLETSVLERLTPSLCDAVRGAADSAALLARLEHEGLFVERSERGYRLHPAVRHVLRIELDQTQPRLVPELHRRAAAWFRGALEPAPEVEHLIACGDTAAAARRVGRAWPEMVDAYGPGWVLARLDRLPAGPTDVRLALARGFLLRLDGRCVEGDAWLDAARRTAPTAVRPAVVRACTLARAVAPWDDVGRALALSRRAWRSERSGPRRALAAWALGWAAWWSGDVVAAESSLVDALEGGPVLVQIAAQAVLARVALAHGAVERAGERARAALAAADAHGLGGLDELGMVDTAAGAVAAARGEGAAALEPLLSGIRRRRLWGHPLETADALVTAAPVVAALEGRKAAADLLAEARRLIAACPDAGVLPSRLAEAARAALPRPDARRDGDELTPRERAVLRLLADGLPKRQIAAELGVSFNTVHSHTKAIYRKLGASSREEAVERMRELGFL